MAKRVLIVEDEQDVAELVAEVLDIEGFESRISNGRSVLDDVVSFDPDIVLLDLMMPAVDGFEVARRLRDNPDTRRVPIVVMTAMHDAAAKAAQVPTPYFVAKPFDIGTLIDKIKEVAL